MTMSQELEPLAVASKSTQEEAVEKVLGHPVAAELTAEAVKVRRNLLVVSVASIGGVIGNVHVDPSSTIFGLKFSGLTNELISKGMFYLTIYFLVHFIWYVIDGFSEWRIRLTGTRAGFITIARLASEEGDYPSEPRQSSLYNWWLDGARTINQTAQIVERIGISLQAWEVRVTNAMQGTNELNKRSAIDSVHRISSDIARLRSTIAQIEKTLTSARIPVSLRRFDSWFLFFLKSQNIRWLIIDAGSPLALGLTALLMLGMQIWGSAI